MDLGKIYKDSDESFIPVEEKPDTARSLNEKHLKMCERIKTLLVEAGIDHATADGIIQWNAEGKKEVFALPLASCDFGTNDIILRATPEIMARGIHAGAVVVDLSDVLGKKKKEN